jgi:AAA+ superfamily predicted ATPase
MANSRIIIPEDLKPYIEAEDCSDFNLNRYYLTDDLAQLFHDIIRMQELTEKMRELKIDYLNTTLLYGLSGTGKTTFARYVANQLDLDFAYINFSKIMGGFGETSRHISDVFRFMADTRCVFMMDEIDCITIRRSRDGGGSSGELSRITITVMQELDYYKKHKVQSIVMGATNRQDVLDEALLSRFAIKHEMRPLTNMEKEEYLINYLRDVGVPFQEEDIQHYCARNSRLEQRNMESDMIQGIARWIENGKKGNFEIRHVK